MTVADHEYEDLGARERELLPLQMNQGRILLSVERLDRGTDEWEASSRPPTVDDLVGGVGALAQSLIRRLKEVDASKVTIEFGCEFALESGKLVAVIGKASTKSSFKIGIEWSAPSANGDKV